jgi:hypothetical protein
MTVFAQAWAMRKDFGRSSGQSRHYSKFGAVAIATKSNPRGSGLLGSFNVAGVGSQSAGDSGCRSMTRPGIVSKSDDREELNYKKRRVSACR